jgi:hypothetical protein
VSITTDQLIEAIKRSADWYLQRGAKFCRTGEGDGTEEDYEVADMLFLMIHEKNDDVIEMIALRLNQVLEEANVNRTG